MIMEPLEHFKIEIKEYCNLHGFELSPSFDWSKFDEIYKKFGNFYCPCRPIAIMKEEKRIPFLCPCVMHKQDIERNGFCYCKLMFKKK